jgi:hypothetical protein
MIALIITARGLRTSYITCERERALGHLYGADPNKQSHIQFSSTGRSKRTDGGELIHSQHIWGREIGQLGQGSGPYTPFVVLPGSPGSNPVIGHLPHVYAGRSTRPRPRLRSSYARRQRGIDAMHVARFAGINASPLRLSPEPRLCFYKSSHAPFLATRRDHKPNKSHGWRTLALRQEARRTTTNLVPCLVAAAALHPYRVVCRCCPHPIV